MANLVHPDKRIDALEKRLDLKDQQVRKLLAANTELTRRLASMQAQIQALSTSLSRLR